MSNPYTGTVASALRKAELLLLSEVEATALARTAFHEAVVLQLWRAYRAFLAELAHQLQLGEGCEPESAQALAERAAASGKTCGEAVELQELGADGDSWLAGLQAAWVQLWNFTGEAGPHYRGMETGGQLIPVANLSSPRDMELNSTLLREWHGALAGLVRRQRAQSQEW